MLHNVRWIWLPTSRSGPLSLIGDYAGVQRVDQHCVRSPSAFPRGLRNSLVVLGVMPNGFMDHFPFALRFRGRTLIHRTVMVAGFGQQLLVAGPARRFEFAGFERRGHC